MSYQYDAKFGWDLQTKKAVRIRMKALVPHPTWNDVEEEIPTPSQQDIEAELFPKLHDVAIQKFTEEFSKEGRTIRVDAVTSQTTNFRTDYDCPINILSTLQWTPCNKRYYFNGETTITFTTDVPPEEAHSIILAIEYILWAIATALAAHQLVTLAIVIIIVWTISAIAYKLTGTSVWTPLAPTNMNEWIAMIVVLVIIVLAALYFFMKRKK